MKALAMALMNIKSRKYGVEAAGPMLTRSCETLERVLLTTLKSRRKKGGLSRTPHVRPGQQLPRNHKETAFYNVPNHG